MKGFVVVLLTVLISRWVASQSFTSKPRKVGDCWNFAPTVAVRGVFFGGVALGLFIIFLGIRGPQGDQAVTVAGGALFIAVVALGWPKTIVFFQNGLKQRNWYGQWKTILWRDIVEVRKRLDDSVLVRGGNSKIVFSTDHSGKDEFLEEMERHGLRVSEKKGYSRR